MSIFRRIATAITFMALMCSFATAANADDTITVESVAYSSDSAAASASDAVNIEINGATQLLWWYPNHHIKVSMKAVKKAPHIKVHYTKCSKQSKSIAKQAKGATIVVAKVGSVICNTGKTGHIVGGFKWKVTKGPAVLKWNSHLKLYQHVYNLIGGKLVKTCGNRMGGHVDHMYGNVTQVRYAGNLEQESNVEASAEVVATVEASKNCPGGKVHASASARASASSSAWVRSKLKYMVSAVNAKKSELLISMQSKVKAQAEAEATAKITITCGDAPPVDNPPVIIDVTQVNDVDVTNTTQVCATVAVQNQGTLTFAARFGSFTTPKTFTVSGQVEKCATYQAPTEVPNGGTDTITYTVRDNTTGKTASDNTVFRINPSPEPPL